MTDQILVLTTVANDEDARRIAEELVGRRLAVSPATLSLNFRNWKRPVGNLRRAGLRAGVRLPGSGRSGRQVRRRIGGGRRVGLYITAADWFTSPSSCLRVFRAWAASLYVGR